MREFVRYNGQVLLEVSQLSARANRGARLILDRISFDLGPGEILGLSGASGSGKTVLARAMLGLAAPGIRLSGHTRIEGVDLVAQSDARARGVLGKEIGLVFQEPMRALDPARRIAKQLAEALDAHGLSRIEGRERGARTLEDLGLDPESVFDAFPRELSGGQLARVQVMLALTLDPSVLILDEPSAALDVRSRRKLEVILDRRAKLGKAAMLISHDPDLLDRTSTRRLQLESGRVGEVRPRAPRHERPREAVLGERVVLEARGASKRFVRQARWFGVGGIVEALSDVSFTLGEGERLGILGESGAGKTTLARAIAGVGALTSGEIRVHGSGVPVREGSPTTRRAVQLVFQDPTSALHPLRSVGSLVGEPIRIHRLAEEAELHRKVELLLESVGLDRDLFDRRPGELSTGQRQRVVIARALAVEPSIVVADEPFASLDAEVADRVVDLLDALISSRRIALVLVSHDVERLSRLTDRLLVLCAGRVVETLASRDLSKATHPETLALIEGWRGKRAGGSEAR
ncbi:MAG: ABC transporter ATP-binding protein [Deltaproteobacteria bacterium]|nr:ABC transporter ATP-binding protein [Deltaproteobacteria bacterium]